MFHAKVVEKINTKYEVQYRFSENGAIYEVA